MPRASFEALNRAQEQAGKPLFANPRNAAAGSLRQLDPKIAAQRKLDILVFNLQLTEGAAFQTHTQTLDYLRSLRFKVIDYKLCKTIDEAVDAITAIGETRYDLPYDIDGAGREAHRPCGARAHGKHGEVPALGGGVQISARGQGDCLAGHRRTGCGEQGY